MIGFDSTMHVPTSQQQENSPAKEVTFLMVFEYLKCFSKK